jgi:signal transduction histidine kinase
MSAGIREKIISITTVILLVTVSVNTLIGSRLFRTSYLDALHSEMYVVCLNLRTQMQRILQLGISVHDVEGFERQCRESVSRYDNVACAMIVQTDGRILFHGGPSHHPQQIDDPKLLAALAAGRETICQSEHEGALFYHMVLPFDERVDAEGANAAAVIGVPAAIVDGQTRRLMSLGLAVGVALSAAALVLLLMSLSRSVTRPLSRLTATIREIAASSDLGKRVEVASSDEFGVLAASFNRMIEDLQRTTTSIDNLHREIDIRRDVENGQAALIEQINSVNKELTDFAYVVSHDLKAPLRGIKTLAQWICEDCADKLNAENREQLDLLMSRVDRMHHMIDGILRYSRVGRTEESVSRVDLATLVPGILDLLQLPESVRFVIEDPLPVVECGETRIGQVFQNLLSNALKYMDKPEGLIRIGCVEDGAFWRFSVADNGPGIEEQYFERIFRIFQTLDRKDEYESTGVGLTITKKIVEQYGGRIWVESRVGQGSTFLFTLPRVGIGGTSDAVIQASAAC